MQKERIQELRYYADPERYALGEGCPPEYLEEAINEIERLQAIIEALPTYTGNACDGCGRNRVEHSIWDKENREICEKCWKVQGSDNRVNPDEDEDWYA